VDVCRSSVEWVRLAGLRGPLTAFLQLEGVVGCPRQRSVPGRGLRSTDVRAIRPRALRKAIRIMEAAERQTFAGMIRAYFALAAFPENADRFPVNYWQIWRAARGRRR
jgi:hypothetical protein